MYAKLAFRNVRRQIGRYLIYFVTVALSVAMMFAVNNLIYSERVSRLKKISEDMDTMLLMITVLVCFVTALILSYATGYMLRLRKKEFGMYLTLGMDRRDIRRLFVRETGILSFFALLVGMACGLALFQLLSALFAAVMDFPFEISAYAPKGIAVTLGVSVLMFVLSTLASLRYLKQTAILELLKEETADRSGRGSARRCLFLGLSAAGLLFCFGKTYAYLMAVFKSQDGAGILLWLALDLVMVFIFHFALAQTLPGLLLRSRRLKNTGTNTVVWRSLSAGLNRNAMLTGALATLLVFAVCMLNVAFSEKLYTEYSLDKERPYDVTVLYDLTEKQPITMEEGKRIIEEASPITGEIMYQLYTTERSDICSSILGYEEMGLQDKFMPLSQFEQLLSGCGWEEIPVCPDGAYLAVTTVQGICEADFSDKTLSAAGKSWFFAGVSDAYPDFSNELIYFVIPDEAIEGMRMSDSCAVYTLQEKRPDVDALQEKLSYYEDTEYGREEFCDFYFREYWRLYRNGTAGALIIGTLYVSTVFVCMALAILSLKTLSTLEDERRRSAVLFCLGADSGMRRAALRRQTGIFFGLPFGFSVLLTVPLGLIFGKVYAFWGFSQLSTGRAVETAVLIMAALAGIWLLYFVITVRVAWQELQRPLEKNHFRY